MDSNQSHEYFGKTLTHIIIVMQNSWFTTLPEITKNKPEKLGTTIEQMDHELPTTC